MTLSDIPRYPLLYEPTLMQRLERIGNVLGHPGLYVKRDDLMPLAMGGNKLRSLEYWIGAAIREHADVLLVAGTPLSNLCRLTAAAASMAGLDCNVYYNAADEPSARRASFLSRIFGARIHFMGAMDERQRMLEVERAALLLKGQGHRPYVVGDVAIGALGYVRAAEELFAQSRMLKTAIRHVVLPGSMGPTEAGFIFGNALMGYPFQVHLVSVEYGRPELSTRVQQAYAALRELASTDAPEFDGAHVNYHMDYLGEGYASPTPAGEEAILMLARLEGIVLEPIYSAKAFAGFLDLVRRRVVTAGDPVCVIHTGGVPSLFAQFESFRGFCELDWASKM